MGEALISVWVVDFLEAKPLTFHGNGCSTLFRRSWQKEETISILRWKACFMYQIRKDPSFTTITTTYQNPCFKHNIYKSLQNSELISIFFDVKRRKCYIVL